MHWTLRGRSLIIDSQKASERERQVDAMKQGSKLQRHIQSKWESQLCVREAGVLGR